MKKLAIVGASHFVNRMFEACGNYQWAREFLKNSLEAGATKVEFGIEWQAVEKEGVYRRTICDNGSGMTREELLRFFSTLGDGAGRIGGVHDNFGVGAKIASLPWNPEGVVVISYKDGRPSMIHIQLDDDGAEYELREFRSDKGITHVIDPAEVDWGTDVNWGAVAADWAREHGTTIVLLGSEEAPDTVLGNPKAGEKDIKGLSVYLNSRFWDLTNPEVTVVELRSLRKTSWPTGPNDRDDARRPNNRRINGAKFYLGEVAASSGKLAAASILPIDESRVQDGQTSTRMRRSRATSPSNTRTSCSSFRPIRRISGGSASPMRKCSKTSASSWNQTSSSRRSRTGAFTPTRAATASSSPATARRASACPSRIGAWSSPRICRRKSAMPS
jgi:hypothetical protein